MKCDRKGCEAEAVGTIRLLLRVHDQHPPAVADVGLKVCDAHGTALEVGQVVSDEGWEQLRDGFLELGKAAPRRELTTVELRRFDALD